MINEICQSMNTALAFTQGDNLNRSRLGIKTRTVDEPVVKMRVLLEETRSLRN